MIINKNKVYAEEIKNFTCLGTPNLVQKYTNQEKKIFCFDLDSTLVSKPKIEGDYNTCSLIKENVEFLNMLYRQGHKIIIYTARRMKTFQGNVFKVKSDIENITINYHLLIN